MKNYKKTFFSSILIFIIATSCCWLTSLAVWLGGAILIGTISSFIAEWQVVFLIISILLLILSGLFYLKTRNMQ